MGIALNLQMAFGRIAIFIMMIVTIQEHGRAFHFLVSSSISFFKLLKFLLNKFFTSLVSVTQRYFMLFVVIVKGDISLISFSASLSFVYRKSTDFFELILYPVTLLKIFIRIIVEFWGSLTYILSYQGAIMGLARNLTLEKFPGIHNDRS